MRVCHKFKTHPFLVGVYKQKELQVEELAALCTQTRDRTGMGCPTGV